MVNLGDEVDTLKAELVQAQYHLDNTQIVAPSDGYVVDLQLREGVFVRLKTPVMTFVDTEEYYLIAQVMQKAIQWVDPGGIHGQVRCVQVLASTGDPLRELVELCVQPILTK